MVIPKNTVVKRILLLLLNIKIIDFATGNNGILYSI